MYSRRHHLREELSASYWVGCGYKIILTLTAPVSQYCSHHASLWCLIYVPKSGFCCVRISSERSATTLKWSKLEPFYFILQEHCESIGSEITKLRAFRDSDCTFGARVRKTAGTRSCCCCIPELLALKGLKISGICHPDEWSPLWPERQNRLFWQWPTIHVKRTGWDRTTVN